MSYAFATSPSDKEDYEFDWSCWLDEGDTISASSWTSSPSGMTLTDAVFSTTTTTVWIAGGTANVDYTVINTITTALGRTRAFGVPFFVRNP